MLIHVTKLTSARIYKKSGNARLLVEAFEAVVPLLEV